MQAKAYFAQFLIQQAWQKTLDDQQEHKPWSWADTHPVAKLKFINAEHGAGDVPDRKMISANSSVENPSLYVLAGASGRNLAFGPAHVMSSAVVNGNGNTVIAGHRDTHFSLLKRVKVGQMLTLQNSQGLEVLYKVINTQVVHETDTSVMTDGGEKQLTLVTCYPFNSPVAGGALRYIVTAVPIDKVEAI
ncbi:Peptidase C60, sortase A and B [Shewanella piezotolerans WP3]|uniref:Peptidase C60, sortase A and B n=2 Tax=Shewanella TaxID=22 RepID=B8CPU3_SHEPW|nr:Peptidase C60, sortase A and B [Shewanella piezotolerans WP3]